MVSHIADQSTQLVLHCVEDQGHRALLDLVLVLELLRPLSLSSGESIAAHSAITLGTLANFVLLDVTLHDLAVEGEGIFLSQLVRELSLLRLYDVDFGDADNIGQSIVTTVVSELSLL